MRFSNELNSLLPEVGQFSGKRKQSTQSVFEPFAILRRIGGVLYVITASFTILRSTLREGVKQGKEEGDQGNFKTRIRISNLNK